MSTKPSTSKKLEPNTVVTRHKSAQMKRQLRTKDDSIRKISQYTQLLRSPSKEKSLKTSPRGVKRGRNMKISPKKEKKEKKSPGISEEYYPNKLKRKERGRRVVLRPSTELKSIGSRRKMAVPRRGVSPPGRRSRSPSLTRLLLTADESLDDDSLMEILTAESPVWWEDPPDHTYTEDPVCISLPPDAEYVIAPKHEHRDTRADPHPHPIQTPPTNNIDDKYMKKRSKLENLLGNIKNKLTVENTGEDFREKVKKELKEAPEDKIKDNKEDIERIEVKEEEKIKVTDEVEKSSMSSHIHSECTDHDSDMNEDIIDNLENMDIPIENDCEIVDTENAFLDKLDEQPNEQDVKEVITIDDCTENVEDAVLSESAKLNETLKTYFEDTKTKEAAKVKAKFTISSIEKISSPISVQSAPSEDAASDISSIVSNTDNVDTISDTNIKFIDEDITGNVETKINDEKDTNKSNSTPAKLADDKDSKILTDTKSKATNDDTDSTKNEKEFFLKRNKKETKIRKSFDKEQLMTVYKIITDDCYRENFMKSKEKEQIKTNNIPTANIVNTEPINKNLDTFYKKCKSNHQKHKTVLVFNVPDKRDDTPKNDNDSTNVRNGNTENNFCSECDRGQTALQIVSDEKTAKYCKKCSSIFETDTCGYCIKKANSNGVECQSCKVKLKT